MKHRSLLVDPHALAHPWHGLLSACAPKATDAPAQPRPRLPPKPRQRRKLRPLQKPQLPRKHQPPHVKATMCLVPKNLGNPYFDTANNGAQEAAKELGINGIVSGFSHRRCH